MNDTIQMVDVNTYTLTARGSNMTLTRRGDGWRMITDNASTRAWRQVASSKDFASLTEVEAHYKSWRGIKALIEHPPVSLN